ncbi:suppressor of lurcher protein 1-like [Gigantopelta aegis]|uniref:suppressor of lurcher protein 1-like n=1 Tax=Gigantopelta aegis TaxID=1735272 RepID=UPI001B88C168|nr:suppressor of lurcher protein 1-like [Gigantopelta aegis]
MVYINFHFSQPAWCAFTNDDEVACDCVIYQSYGGSSGRFTSPNFPKNYPRDSTCILYTFIGDVDEIIELTFLEFDMRMPTSNNVCTDFLRLFLNLDRPEVNEHNRYDLELCGNITMIGRKYGKKYYSASRSLILELHADGYPGNYTGFQGRYQFLDKNQFTIDGTKIPGTPCTYYFDSNKNKKSGNFFSPFYPQNYKPNYSCQYHFIAGPDEKVKIVFRNIQLYPSDGSCQFSKDAIKVHDGRDKSAVVIGHYCDLHNQVELMSSQRYLFIQFYSDDIGERKGFAATYQFTSNNPQPPTPNPMLSLNMSANGYATSRPSITSSKEFQCNDVIRSINRKNGTIKSPFYPQSYPADIVCRYTFQGVGRERVQLHFKHMDLHYPAGDASEPVDCAGSDSVIVFITLNGKNENLGTFCGKKLPPKLMSNEAKMTVEFRSTQPSQSVTGFEARYSFVTNFGITSGVQDDRGVCMFNYYSATSSSGKFTSPNYPGLYPRDTECHYLFYGAGDETVFIQFPVFAVDGISPRCEEATKSDFVSFSNFAEAEDRKLHRLCGNSLESRYKTIESDGPFFRVVFKSNGIYDANGFEAYYEFRGVNNDRSKYRSSNNKSEKKAQQVTKGRAARPVPAVSVWTALFLVSAFI